MFFLARTVGFEPTPQGFGDPQATITTRPYIKGLVRREGLEPPVFTLEGRCISRYATGAFGGSAEKLNSDLWRDKPT